MNKNIFLCITGILLLLTYFPGVRPAPALEALNTSQMRSVEGRAGINLETHLSMSADALELIDPDGSNLGPGGGSSGELELGGVTLSNGGSANYTQFTLDVDGTDGVVLDIPSSDANWEIDFNQVSFPNDAGELHFNNVDVTQSRLEVGPDADGLTLDGEINVSLNSITYRQDATNHPDAQNQAGMLVLDNPTFAGGSYTFYEDIQFDDSHGIIFPVPGSSFDFSISKICTHWGSGAWGESENCGGGGMPTIARNVQFNSVSFPGDSELYLQGAGKGLTIDGQIELEIGSISLTDNSGTPQDGTAGTATFNNIRFTDASNDNTDGQFVGEGAGGDPVEFSSPAEFHIDGDRGAFLKMPGFDISGGSFDEPANELYIQNMGVGGACNSNCGDWSVRNLDLSGSWMNLEGRN